MKKNFRNRYIYFFTIFVSLISFFYFQNNSIVITEYNIRSMSVPKSFDGYKIVQLSDLHSKSFGVNQSKIVKKIEKVKPDLIVFTGDLVDSKRYNEENSLLLMRNLTHIAPVYFVTGNHEWWSSNFRSLEVKLNTIGVQILRNTVSEINNEKDKIKIIGIDDPTAVNILNPEQEIAERAIRDSFKGQEVDNSFNILLSHRPELFPLYSQFDFDLVFSGHAHGGQVGIPILGGLIAPNQGFFPTYFSGKHTLDNTTMIVNRGLGNSVIPLRLFNRPEIVFVTLESTK